MSRSGRHPLIEGCSGAGKAATLTLIGMLGACQSISSAVDDEFFSSLPYDEYSCEDLADLRDREARRFNLPQDATHDHAWAEGIIRHPPLGTLLPDMRSQAERAEGIARGRISAMNRSLARRGCEGAVESE